MGSGVLVLWRVCLLNGASPAPPCLVVSDGLFFCIYLDNLSPFLLCHFVSPLIYLPRSFLSPFLLSLVTFKVADQTTTCGELLIESLLPSFGSIFECLGEYSFFDLVVMVDMTTDGIDDISSISSR